MSKQNVNALYASSVNTHTIACVYKLSKQKSKPNQSSLNLTKKGLSKPSGPTRKASTNNYVDWDILFTEEPKTPAAVSRSQSVMEFQQLMKNDARSALHHELEKLVNTAQKDDREVTFYILLLICIVLYTVLHSLKNF